MKFKLEETDRGFRIAKFSDRYGQLCTIQESSLGDERALWIGVSADMNNRDVRHGRMHLTQAQVVDLIPVLQRFLETGELEIPESIREEDEG